jgi:murein DD-endopeptidase MepM/ murein hydrolase activator NlpD
MATLAVALSGGCTGIAIDEVFAPVGVYDEYRRAIETLGLTHREAGRRWIEAGVSALENPVSVSLPFVDSGVFGSDTPSALGYGISARRGQRITVFVSVESTAPDTARPYFVDLYSRAAPFEHLATLPEGRTVLAFEPRTDAEYVIRIQPELLVDARYDVSISIEPALAFPVSGADFSDIGSFFGAPRDGGAREHHGVDIFAPRGTFVLAPSPGIVQRVGTTNRGGNVVFVADDQRALRYYFAHLDTQLVRRGQRVRTGDILGTVGNTGNALTTPPHLHFGIYAGRWGPVDPYYFLYDFESQAELQGGAQ